MVGKSNVFRNVELVVDAMTVTGSWVVGSVLHPFTRHETTISAINKLYIIIINNKLTQPHPTQAKKKNFLLICKISFAIRCEKYIMLYNLSWMPKLQREWPLEKILGRTRGRVVTQMQYKKVI